MCKFFSPLFWLRVLGLRAPQSTVLQRANKLPKTFVRMHEQAAPTMAAATAVAAATTRCEAGENCGRDRRRSRKTPLKVDATSRSRSSPRKSRPLWSAPMRRRPLASGVFHVAWRAIDGAYEQTSERQAPSSFAFFLVVAVSRLLPSIWRSSPISVVVVVVAAAASSVDHGGGGRWLRAVRLVQRQRRWKQRAIGRRRRRDVVTPNQQPADRRLQPSDQAAAAAFLVTRDGGSGGGRGAQLPLQIKFASSPAHAARRQR